MYHPARIWVVIFAILTISFVTDIYVVIKGIRKKKIGLFDIIPSLSLPFLILWMLTDNELTIGEKTIDSIIASVCVVSAIVNIYVLRKEMPQDKKE